MKTLVLTEKPDAARDMAEGLDVAQRDLGGWFESDRYVVTWSVGHLIRLNSPEAYNPAYKQWSLEQLPIVPETFRYHVSSRGKEQFEVIRDLLGRADIERVVLATDAGREGELIGRLLLDKAGNARPVWRFWTSAAWTPSVVRAGMQALRPASDYDNLFHAALARQQADWLVGINASRALSVRAALPGEHYALGRVKTPTLALVVRRQREIDEFSPETYWTVKARFLHGSEEYLGAWVGSAVDELPDKFAEPADPDEADVVGTRIRRPATAKRIIREICPGQILTDAKASETRILPLTGGRGGVKGVVADIKRSTKCVPPPPLFSLTTLQQTANQKFGFSLEKTDALAQSLYQKHKAISYPRTESQVLGAAQADEIPAVLNALAARHRLKLDKAVVDAGDKRIFNDARLVEDHHAIIPNGLPLRRPDPDEEQLYLLIVRRFVAAFLPDYVYDSLQVLTAVNGEVFKTTKSMVADGGWKEFYNQEVRAVGQRDAIDSLQPGDEVRLKFVLLGQEQTAPPPAYNDASLVNDMVHAAKFVEDEKMKAILRRTNGIGTPATRSAILKELVEGRYLVRTGRTIRPTPKAKALIGVMEDEPIAQPGLTAYWEDQLDRIAHGNGCTLKDFQHEIVEHVRQLVDAARTIAPDRLDHGEAVGPCPACGGDVREQDERYVCRHFPQCSFSIRRKSLAKLGKAELLRAEMQTLLRRQPLKLEKLRDRKGKLFSTHLRLERHEKYGWQVAFGQPAASTAPPAPAPAPGCDCVGTPAGALEPRPAVHSLQTLVFAADLCRNALGLTPEDAPLEPLSAAFREAGNPPQRDAFLRQLRHASLLPEDWPQEGLPDPRRLLADGYREACHLWILANGLHPRIPPQRPVCVRRADQVTAGTITGILPQTGHYRVELSAAGGETLTVPWEDTTCPACNQPGIATITTEESAPCR